MLIEIRTIFLIALLVSLAGCATSVSDKKWPTDVPERKIFVDGYLKNRGLTKAEPKVLNAHLVWVVRFYQGTVLYPNGWNNVSNRFLNSIKETKDRDAMATRLYTLGIDIANEWAQDNVVRKINSSNVATWGSALRTSAETNDQNEFISAVERDVDLLLKGSLKPSEIKYERYYPEEDYDDF